MEEEKAEDVAPAIALSTPSPEARVLLCRLTSAMAARPAGLRPHTGSWSPTKLGLTDRLVVLRLDDLSEGTRRRLAAGVMQGSGDKRIGGECARTYISINMTCYQYICL